MKAIRSPAWNSSVANLKERIGKQLKTPQGFNLGQALSFLDGVLRKPDVSVDAPDQPGNTYDPASEDLSGFMATPEAQQPGGELEWDPQTQTFKPVR